MTINNLRIQSTVLELLQGIVARGELDPVMLETTESAIIGRLYAAVHANKLDLQNKLLHVLHSVVFATSSAAPTRKASRETDGDAFNRAHRTASNPLFVQTLIDGISRSSNLPALQHWIDFVMMTVAQFRSLSHAISPLCDCICRQLKVFVTELEGMLSHEGKGKAPLRWSLSDSDVLLLLNALERLVLLSVSKSDEPSVSEEPTPPDKAQNETSTGILGYVFGSENPHNTENDPPLVRDCPILPSSCTDTTPLEVAFFRVQGPARSRASRALAVVDSGCRRVPRNPEVSQCFRARGSACGIKMHEDIGTSLQGPTGRGP